MSKILRKIIVFTASTVLTSGVTSLGTVVVNKLQTEDNKTIQQQINQQFVENDEKILKLLDTIDKRLKKIEK